jgi:hypothetical protein
VKVIVGSIAIITHSTALIIKIWPVSIKDQYRINRAYSRKYEAAAWKEAGCGSTSF